MKNTDWHISVKTNGSGARVYDSPKSPLRKRAKIFNFIYINELPLQMSVIQICTKRILLNYKSNSHAHTALFYIPVLINSVLHTFLIEC